MRGSRDRGSRTGRLGAVYGAVVESMGDAVIIVDGAGRVLYCNPAARDLLGKETDDLPIARVLVGESFDDVEVVRGPLCLNVSGRPFCDEEKRAWGGFLVCRDVTAARRAQAEAEAANRAKDDFVALVSHELRTPVTPIRAWTRVLRRTRLDDAQFERTLDAIDRNVDALVHLIDDLLDSTRIASGKLHLELRPVELRELIGSALESLQPAIAGKRLVLDTRMERTLILGDPARLQQVLWNLLANAVKFTPAGGHIDVQLREAADGGAEIAVSDTGQGIAPDLLPFVFQPYRQGPGSPHRGLGLGLSIARHIVEAHGGRIEAESAGVGQGARFVVSLPPPAAAVEPVPVFRSSSGTDLVAAAVEGTILKDVRTVIVADADTAAGLEILLANCGAEVRCAHDAPRGLLLLEERAADVIVVDPTHLADSGAAFLRAARAGRSATPAVALTTADPEGDGDRRCSQAGFDHCLSKPIDPTALITLLAGLARRDPRPGADRATG